MMLRSCRSLSPLSPYCSPSLPLPSPFSYGKTSLISTPLRYQHTFSLKKEVVEDVQLDFQDSFSSKNKIRNAEQIQSLVDSVKLVREQVKAYSQPTVEEEPAPTQAKPLEKILSVTNPKSSFISLVLDENVGTIKKSKSRYMTLQEIKTNAENGINQTQRIFSEFAKGELNPHEIQMLASIDPSPNVIEKALEYCKKEKLFKPACGVVSIAFAAKATFSTFWKKSFVILMKDFPIGHETAHVVATYQAAKEHLKVNEPMYNAVISRLAQTPDCNPETIDSILADAKAAKVTLLLSTYNHLIRYYATMHDLVKCETLAKEAKMHEKSENYSITLCLVTQAACIVHNLDKAWDHFQVLKERKPNCLVVYKNLYKHLVAAFASDVEKNLPRIVSIFNELTAANVTLQVHQLLEVLQSEPGFPFFCVPIITYMRQKRMKPHPDFLYFVNLELFKLKHSDFLRFYITLRQRPTPAMMEAIGTILQSIPALPEDTSLVESYITYLTPPSAPSSPSSSSSPSPSSSSTTKRDIKEDIFSGSVPDNFTRDAFVYAVAIDMYGKLGQNDAALHTYQYMIHEGVTPNFLVHALLFRMHYFSGNTELRDHHLKQMQTLHPQRLRGVDIAWLALPLLVTHIDLKQYNVVGTLLPKVVPFLALDERAWNDALNALLVCPVKDLACELLRLMGAYEPSLVTPSLFQPLLDFAFQQKTTESEKEKVPVTETEQEKSETKVEEEKETAKEAEKEKKEKKEELDPYMSMREMKMTPTSAQAEQAMKYYLDNGKLQDAATLLADMRSYSPKVPVMQDWHSKFLLLCVEKKEMNMITQVLKRTTGAFNFTQDQHFKLVDKLISFNLIPTAMDVLRWMSSNAPLQFSNVRKQFLEIHNNKENQPVWIKSLQKIS